MAPEAKSEDLLYVSTSGGVAVYSYPAAVLVGTLSLLSPAGLCADNAGNVWITGNQQIFEYAHGGSQPIATLDDSGYSSKGCAVDPTTGDLAVTNFVGAKRHQRGTSLFTTTRRAHRGHTGHLLFDGLTIARTTTKETYTGDTAEQQSF